MIVPAAYFHQMSERVKCDGSWETGSVVVAQDKKVRYIRSIAELTDRNGVIVGWIYLADDYGKDEAEYVHGADAMPETDVRLLGLRRLSSGGTDAALLRNALPKGITIRVCSVPTK